jgi:hypothetical protein
LKEQKETNQQTEDPAMEWKSRRKKHPLHLMTDNYGLEHGVQILSEIFCESLLSLSFLG